MFVDSHCHLDRLDPEKVGSIDKVLDSARGRGVQGFLCIATHLNGFQDVKILADQYDDVYCSAGIHPLQDNLTDINIERLLEQASDSSTVAVGETGLDYHYAKETRAAQLESFEKHIEVAKQVNKPLIIHTRSAVQDTLDMLVNKGAEQVGGVLHCFTESLEMAQKAIEMGFYISFSGILTFKTADSLRAIAKTLPLDRILIETDCPWLAPVPYRGKENQPAYVVEVAQIMADIHKVSISEIANKTTENFYKCFPLTV